MIDYHNFMKSVSNDFNIPYSDMTDLWWKKYNEEITRGIITPQELWNKIRDELRISEGANYDFLGKWIGDYVRIQSIYDLIVNLSHSYKIGILSNIYTGMIEQLLNKKIIAQIKYNVIVASCDTNLRKPEIAIYELAEKKAGVLPDEILFIDDKLKFIEPAKKLGWNTILFDTNNPNVSVAQIASSLHSSQ